MSFRPPRPSRRFRSLFLLTLSLIGLIYWASPDQLSLQTIPFPFRPLQTPLSIKIPRPDHLGLIPIHDALQDPTDPNNEPLNFSDPCDGWNHFDPESFDPPECKRARMYRQVERLRVDETGLLFNMTWHFQIRTHNTQTLTHLSHCLLHPTTPPTECSPNVSKVIVGVWWWFDMVLVEGSESGETVWMRTIIEVLKEEGYSFLSVSHNQYVKMVELHRVIPDVISMIWAQDTLTVSCIADPRCLADHPQAHMVDDALMRGTIPLHKLFTLTYWGARPENHTKQSWEFGNTAEMGNFSFNPLGNAWTISPWPYPEHTYIPLSIERECTKNEVVPFEERKDQALILAKLLQYFYSKTFQFALDINLWTNFEASTGLVPLGTTKNLHEGEYEDPPGLINLGPLKCDLYDQKLAESKVLVGIGRPEISPSPYSALCQGVPSVLPYFGSDPIPEGWDLYHQDLAQHGPASQLGEPYVYLYHYKDTEGMFNQIRKAAETPIKRYIPPDMTYQAAKTAVLAVLERDWHTLAEQIDTESTILKEAYQNPLVVHEDVIERCFKLGNCRRVGEDGSQSTVRP